MAMSRDELKRYAANGAAWAIKALAEVDNPPSKSVPPLRVRTKADSQPDLCERLAAQLHSIGAPEFRWSKHPEGEFAFHPRRRWRLDFYFPVQKVAIEVEGGISSHRRKTAISAAGDKYAVQSRHLTPAGFEEDAIKYFEAEKAGISVVRVSSSMISKDKAISMAIQILESRGFSFTETSLLGAYRDVISN